MWRHCVAAQGFICVRANSKATQYTNAVLASAKRKRAVYSNELDYDSFWDAFSYVNTEG